MILLDTNIVSEVMRPKPDSGVVDWLNRQYSPDLYVSAITIGEIVYGLAILTDGRRKQDLQLRFESFLKKAFAYRVLGFSEHEARNYGRLMGQSKDSGRPMSVPDAQIAAIALTNGYALATRNIKDFQHSGLTLINPFDQT